MTIVMLGLVGMGMAGLMDLRLSGAAEVEVVEVVVVVVGEEEGILHPRRIMDRREAIMAGIIHPFTIRHRRNLRLCLFQASFPRAEEEGVEGVGVQGEDHRRINNNNSSSSNTAILDLRVEVRGLIFIRIRDRDMGLCLGRVVVVRLRLEVDQEEGWEVDLVEEGDQEEEEEEEEMAVGAISFRSSTTRIILGNLTAISR